VAASHGLRALLVLEKEPKATEAARRVTGVTRQNVKKNNHHLGMGQYLSIQFLEG